MTPKRSESPIFVRQFGEVKTEVGNATFEMSMDVSGLTELFDELPIHKESIIVTKEEYHAWESMDDVVRQSGRQFIREFAVDHCESMAVTAALVETPKGKLLSVGIQRDAGWEFTDFDPPFRKIVNESLRRERPPRDDQS